MTLQTHTCTCTRTRTHTQSFYVLPFYDITKQESLANAKVNTRQHCVNEMPITDYVSEYNNFSLGDEDLENIASERYENRHLRRSVSCLTSYISRTPANICIILISLENTPWAIKNVPLLFF